MEKSEKLKQLLDYIGINEDNMAYFINSYVEKVSVDRENNIFIFYIRVSDIPKKNVYDDVLSSLSSSFSAKIDLYFLYDGDNYQNITSYLYPIIDSYIMNSMRYSVFKDREVTTNKNKLIFPVYNKLEETQNFGVSLIHDAIAKEENSEDYIVDPTNNSVSNDMLSENSIFKPMSTDFTEQDLTDVKLQSDFSNDNSNSVATTQTQSTQLTETNSDATNNRNLSFQERLYLENEKKMHEQNVSEDLQNSLNAKTKTLTLKNNYGKMNNAAYITISWLLYIIGSFELFIVIFLMAKFF